MSKSDMILKKLVNNIDKIDINNLSILYNKYKHYDKKYDDKIDNYFRYLEKIGKINPQQWKFVCSGLSNMKLLGIPGGGKTKTIIDKIVYCHKNKIIKNANEFLVLTFSRRAMDDFIEKGKRINKKLFNKFNIRTLHSLSAVITNKLFNKNSKCLSTIVISTLYNIKNSFDTISFNDINCLSNCKFIVVDEAQDISEVQYNLINIIAKKLEIPVIMVGDPNQNIYQFQNGSDKYLLEHPTLTNKNISLVNNYRSTIEIVDFINEFRPWKENVPKMISANRKHGRKPILYCNDVNNILQHILFEIENSKYKKEDIAIIGPVKKSKPNNDGVYTNIGLQLIANMLHNNGIKYMQHYSIGNDSHDIGDDYKFNKKDGYVNILTIHGSKGLEFKKVLVINFHFTTMGIRPDIRKYGEFKYLWYVGLSRAQEELIMYVEKNKLIWPQMLDCPKHLYKLEGVPYKEYVPKFDDIKKEAVFDITKIIYDNKYFNDDALFKMQGLMNYSYTQHTMFEVKNKLKGHEKDSSLLGIYMEQIFTYYYHKYRLQLPKYIDWIKDYFNRIIIIPEHLNKHYKSFKSMFPVGCFLTLGFIHQFKSSFNDEVMTIYNHIYKILKGNLDKEFMLYCESIVCTYDIDKIQNLCKQLSREKNEDIVNEIIFELVLHIYALEHEAIYLLEQNFDQYTGSKSPLYNIIEEIKRYVILCDNNYEFQKLTIHPNLPLIGKSDIIKPDGTIVEIKFIKHITVTHIIQLLLYYNNLYPNWQSIQPKKLELWNLYDGIKYVITIDKNLNNYTILKFLCDILNIKMKNNVFAYDLETTGLIEHSHGITFFPDIIERHFQELYLDYVPSSGLIKPPFPLSKLVENITGIKNSELNKLASQDLIDKDLSRFKNEIDEIYKYCDRPIFIAHNGNSFDHKILMQKNIIDTSKCRTMDSKMIIRLFYNDGIDLFNKKLEFIYNTVVGKEITGAHRASVDVQMMIEIFHKLNISRDLLCKNG
jgi:thymidine kinase